MRIVRQSVPITSFDEWASHAPPKGGDRQWADGRSAKELARAWCGPGGPAVPEEVATALRSHPDLAGLRIVEMTPEARVRFDKRRGEPRNADLAGTAEHRDGLAVVHVEGKADETFGQSVRDVRAAAQAIREGNKSTGAPERVHDLLTSLLPPGTDADSLRYQLLTAVAATLADARDRAATVAVLVIHEFVTDRTRDDRHRDNANDLDSFVSAISGGSFSRLPAGTAVGPIRVPGTPLIDAPVALYLVKAERRTRSPAS